MEIKPIGLNTKKWADWRSYLLTHGNYDPNDWHELNSYQKQWTQDTLNTLKSLNYENDN